MSQNITQEELTRLKSTKNETEWNSVCDSIKGSRGGAYPSDWFIVVLASGLADQIQMSWFRR